MRAKSLFVVVIMLSISIFDTNLHFVQLQMEGEHFVEESEKKYKDKR
jgi:hypothetical protein